VLPLSIMVNMLLFLLQVYHPFKEVDYLTYSNIQTVYPYQNYRFSFKLLYKGILEYSQFQYYAYPPAGYCEVSIY